MVTARFIGNSSLAFLAHSGDTQQVSEARQWLLPAWVRSMQEAGATASDAELAQYGDRLLNRWGESGRRFHTIKHLKEVLARVDELSEETYAPSLVRIAAWYHGAVFDAQGQGSDLHPGIDENAGAEIAEKELRELGLPEKNIDRVRELILALDRHSPRQGDYDSAALCDADMSILAAEPQRYQRYLDALREEYSHVPKRNYLEARRRIITKLLSRPRLFNSPGGVAWEGAARENLEVEQMRIDRELAKETNPTEPSA